MKNRLTALLGALAVFAVVLLGGGREARADLAYHGGPVLKSFEIVPYYYGPWDAATRDQHQQYLVGLAQYMSGANAPYGQQPTLVQYGVTAVGVRPPVIETNVATPVSLDTPAALAVIHAAQAAGKLPPYSANRLILLMVPPSIDLTVHCAYHGAEDVGKYYAFVSQACGPWLQVTSHEVFEAATDPAINHSDAWDEAVDPCGTSFNLWFGPVPGAWDNTAHGCSTTGYYASATSAAPGTFAAVWRPGNQPEIQVNGWTYAAYRARYDELWNAGFRLALLQPYVSNGQVLYNAVWRPSSEGEIQIYGATYSQYRAKYDALWGQGWRLKILQPYVVNGSVFYTAVWHPSSEGEIQIYDASYDAFRAQYDQLWNQGWRLKLLQPYSVYGNVYYTAVWQQSTASEYQVYGWAYADLRAKYDQLWPQGWRLKLLQPYLVNGQVRYSAVFHRATNGEVQVYDWSNGSYRSENDSMRSQGMQLQSLTAF